MPSLKARTVRTHCNCRHPYEAQFPSLDIRPSDLHRSWCAIWEESHLLRWCCRQEAIKGKTQCKYVSTRRTSRVYALWCHHHYCLLRAHPTDRWLASFYLPLKHVYESRRERVWTYVIPTQALLPLPKGTKHLRKRWGSLALIHRSGRT